MPSDCRMMRNSHNTVNSSNMDERGRHRDGDDGTSASSAENEISRLLPTPHSDRGDGNASSLCKKDYDIDPLRHIAPLTLSRASKAIVALLLSPVIGSLLGLLTIVMCLGPNFLRHAWISWFIPKACRSVDQQFEPERRKLLYDVSGRVLDVGSGGGAYLRYCYGSRSKVTAIVALEPVWELHGIIRAEADKQQQRRPQSDDNPNDNDCRPSLTILAMDVETYVKEQLPKGSKPEQLFDWVILGNVLCEVRDQQSTLRAIDQCLKPGGRVYFSEHVACSTKLSCNGKSFWLDCNRRFQSLINPWWRTVSGGCNVNRDTLDAIVAVPGWHVISWCFRRSTSVIVGPMVLGLAQKTTKRFCVRTHRVALPKAHRCASD